MRRKEKVKLFCYNNQIELEKAVNQWMDENKKLTLVNIAYSVQSSGMAHCCVIYR